MTDHDQLTGRQLKTAGTEATIAASIAAHRNYRAVLEVALETLVMSGREFTADDVWPLVDEDTRQRAPANLLPALFAGAVNAGRIVRVGFECSTRPSRHGGLFRRWRAAA